MSLLAWYPLNGDTKNYGALGDSIKATIPVTPTYSDEGKLGKGLLRGNISWDAASAEKILGHKQLTISMWWKNLSTGTDKKMIFGNDGMASNGGRKFSLFRYSTKNDLHWSWQSDEGVKSSASTASAGIVTKILPDDEWTHICITYDSPAAKLYINGEFKQNLSTATNMPYHFEKNTFNYATTMIYDSDSRICNDYRFYDEALTPGQVKEIYKTKVVDIDFQDYWNSGTKNIMTSQTTGISNNLSTDPKITGNGTIYTIPKGITTWSSGIQMPRTNVKAGKTYCVSCRIKDVASNGKGWKISWDTNIFGTNYTSSNDTGHTIIRKGIVGEGTGDTIITLANYEKICYYIFKTKDDIEGAWVFSNLLPRLVDENLAEGKIQIYNWMCEEGDTPSIQFVAAGETSLPNICDATGLGHDGISGPLPLKIKQGEGPGNTYVDLTDINYQNWLKIKNSPTFTKGFTWNVWMKAKSGVTSQQYIVSQGRDWTQCSFGLNIYIAANGDGAIVANFGDIATGNSKVYDNSKNFRDDTWHMVTVVCREDNFFEIYTDGVKKMTSSKAYTPNYEQGDGGIVIGKMSYGHAGTGAYFDYSGYIGEFTEWATPLSEDDIASLYKTKGRVYRNNDAAARYVVEDSGVNMKIEKNGVLYTKELFEIDENKNQIKKTGFYTSNFKERM